MIVTRGQNISSTVPGGENHACPEKTNLVLLFWVLIKYREFVTSFMFQITVAMYIGCIWSVDQKIPINTARVLVVRTAA